MLSGCFYQVITRSYLRVVVAVSVTVVGDVLVNSAENEKKYQHGKVI